LTLHRSINRLVGKNGGWTTTINDHGDAEWHPPTDLDTGQTRVNDYHRPERLRPPRDELFTPTDEPAAHRPPVEGPPFDDEWLIGPPDYEPIHNPPEPGGPEPNAA
jgi:hypothetical protein